ncbi:MAG: hypothetical protein A2487_09340 [Candidatus Raymondbacteria bacterium RifOxyC12_full_50_8]|uniref:Fido domain-containing protein n=1 Tax=Candidatus Raymondbacteria bacterium RIFOXYD12_FULL_49_13 TaxID=1817890 RepID=A0A1F7FIF0_UNCRA|nr:MAG: hypothetical protein A2248_21385 [Candidatus Raymondbacteria bacterium RIFOXYA2_FULL_49_16]OGJ96773.1 MAG: hypothetical protein A2487_09340 [Candidatus Raymondbacteria bacterium RifOxyC12_full_50_8]OGK06341.1 MAG: hypothetical protein A2519_08705 [Candidatus Raymondbacteria bacterium RIFOXYD12_FULL_49_13]OGP40675.1 MAG: hypothetical protein A2324_03455 [Candidatus Raymondbacteria bacterium RIFOXYB2_FULL_49_35]
MAFQPRYTITPRMLDSLMLIAEGRAVIENARLLPSREAQLRRNAQISSTHSSTAIEGNKLTLEQVQTLAQGGKVAATEKDKQEVLNYLNALEKIQGLAVKGKISAADLLKMHGAVSRKVLNDDRQSGAFRDVQVFVGKVVFSGTSFKEEVAYTPPPAAEVKGLVEEFIAWLNIEQTWETNPVLLAGISHYEIARIHPFVDGNGRTARLFASLVLYLSGFDHRRLFTLDEFYDRDRKSYYAALKAVQEDNGDLTRWLEYFTQGVSVSVNEVRNAVAKTGGRSKGVTDRQITLSSRQTEMIEYLTSHGKLTNQDVQKMYKISAQAAHKELSKLIKINAIKSKGHGRSVHYLLK